MERTITIDKEAVLNNFFFYYDNEINQAPREMTNEKRSSFFENDMFVILASLLTGIEESVIIDYAPKYYRKKSPNIKSILVDRNMRSYR
jgi:hypothetical protein